MLKLYSYYRSSASFRARIALNIKQLEHEIEHIDLSKKIQFSEEYLHINPQGMVPTLIDGDLKVVQSLAILEYLEEAYPTIALLPASPAQRSQVRGIMQIIACEIQPTGNLAMLHHLRDHYNLDENAQMKWAQDWIYKGFTAIEALLKEYDSVGLYSFGDTPTLADVCLYPQVFNARRFQCDLTGFPLIAKIAAHCDQVEDFYQASPAAFQA